jgi:hypothetical protein
MLAPIASNTPLAVSSSLRLLGVAIVNTTAAGLPVVRANRRVRGSCS